ncbi:hypothetical protein BC830DRAFT_1110074 [Chytriomyces sp. MP71]|nr:hypothetical protein BC830DRAFT_1110074 [Chytriomyces sp. MP71]
MLKSAIKTHVENSLAQTKRIQTLTSENESLKQEVASLQHKLASQQLLHQQQPHRHASTPQPKAHLPAATPLFSVPPPMKPKHLQHQQQHHPLSFQQDQPEQNFQHQLRQSSSQQNSPQENFSRHYMQTIPPFSPSQTPLSIPHISKVSSRAATPAPINRVNIRTTPHASSSLRQQHIQTPIPPARLSLPRPGSAMSGTSGPGSVSSLSPRGSMNQFQNTSSMRPSSNGSSGSHAPFRSSAPPQTMQGRISNTPMQGAASLPSTMHGHAPSAMQQATYARQGSQQPMQASFARQGAQPPLQQRNASSVPVDQQRRDGDMVIDVDLDDADAFQRQKRMTQQQQQQRPASVATGGRERVSRSLGGVGKTVLNRGGFNAASGGAAGPAVARSRGSSVGGREFGSGRAATPQVYSTR